VTSAHGAPAAPRAQGMLLHVLLALGGSAALVLAYALGVVLRPAPLWAARWAVPLLGLLLGGAVGGVAAGLSAILDELGAGARRRRAGRAASRGSGTLDAALLCRPPSAGRCSVLLLRGAGGRAALGSSATLDGLSACADCCESGGQRELCFGAFCRQRSCPLERGAGPLLGVVRAWPGAVHGSWPGKDAQAPGVCPQPVPAQRRGGRRRPAARQVQKAPAARAAGSARIEALLAVGASRREATAAAVQRALAAAAAPTLSRMGAAGLVGPAAAARRPSPSFVWISRLGRACTAGCWSLQRFKG